ncbi:phage polarity suppression protein [Enterobacter sp. Tr-810]|uniref:phage polarity suppression protein n=1 Tax=Enterobacter sp. Tr-810 TaxID=2608347 RepID=UPI0024955385|nr:phage polarity suppression protein [Enterobacter sp. Tr-810]
MAERFGFNSLASDFAGQIEGTKKPAGLAPCGLSGLHRSTLVIANRGGGLAAALAPELMGYNSQHPAVRNCAMQHSVDYLREALNVWLAAGEKINFSAQDNDILTAIGFRLDVASRDDNREKFTPAQNQNYVRKRAELAAL